MPTLVVNIRVQAYDVYIARPSCWGNPWSHLSSTTARFRVATREEAVEKYRAWIQTQPQLLARLHELRGKRLGCWCPESKPCHGHVLAELADGVDHAG